jgi:outer membrane receptor for ferrienterochelin and colicins
VGKRDTIASNPIPQVPSWAAVDVSVGVDDVIARGLGLSLRVTNAFDAEYFQPGVREASAGNTPGFFDARGAWVGSGGFYNSLLPQPGRAVLLTLRIHGD